MAKPYEDHGHEKHMESSGDLKTVLIQADG